MAMRDYGGWARRMLDEHFGFKEFRPGQLDVVNAILNRRDVLAVMPTGAGKSACYQIPSCASSAASGPALTLVITPLRALMRDQVQQLETRGIPAAMIDSGTAYEERMAVAQAVSEGRLRLLYVAPERLSSPAFRGLCASTRIRLVAVDEAHCVLQWGQDFRPDYLGIRAFVESLPTRPVVAAFTATATPRMRDGIAANLGLRDPVRVATSFDRPNLYFGRMKAGTNQRMRIIADFANARRGESGIVYCGSRKRTEKLAEALKDAGVNAEFFHARMDESRKLEVQDAFLDDRIDVIVATTAFGMGVDKSDVRWVINDGLPASMEEYYQEAGRAGRDRQAAECHLLWSPHEFTTLRQRIAEETGGALEDAGEQSRAKAAARARLNVMDAYCTQDVCLRAQMLAYFGNPAAAGGAEGVSCSGCDVCAGTCAVAPDLGLDGGAGSARGGRTVSRTKVRRGRVVGLDDGFGSGSGEVDERLRQQVLDYVTAIFEAKGNGFGVTKIVNGLRGSRSKGVLETGLDRIEGYGSVPLATSDQIRSAVRQLVDDGKLEYGLFKTLVPAGHGEGGGD